MQAQCLLMVDCVGTWDTCTDDRTQGLDPPKAVIGWDR